MNSGRLKLELLFLIVWALGIAAGLRSVLASQVSGGQLESGGAPRRR